MIVLGIDPGLKGAWALLEFDGGRAELFEAKLLDWGKKYGKARLQTNFLRCGFPCVERICIESQRTMGGRTSRKSAFTIGFCYAQLLAAAERLFTPIVFCPPEGKDGWQRQMLAGMPGGDTKTKSYNAAKKLVGRGPLLIRGKWHDGIADAVNIAHWAYLNREGVE